MTALQSVEARGHEGKRRTESARTACLILGVVIATVGLSACGNGGGSSAPEAANPAPGNRASDIVITPPGVPRAVGSIPSQTLTTGANARTVDVAPYFQDPDNDQLTYLAVSERPSILEVSVTGSTVILTPASAGITRITVTASDGNASTAQTIAATVRVPQNSLLTRQVPEIMLTGVEFVVERAQTRRSLLRVTPQPAGAELPSLSFRWDQGSTAGRASYLDMLGSSAYFWFRCAEGFNGDVTITLTFSRSPIEKYVSVTCQ